MSIQGKVQFLNTNQALPAEKLQAISLTDICRLCMKSWKSSTMTLLKETPSLEILRRISTLELRLDNFLYPKRICIKCSAYLHQLQEIDQFIKQCKTSQDTLKQLFKGSLIMHAKRPVNNTNSSISSIHLIQGSLINQKMIKSTILKEQPLRTNADNIIKTCVEAASRANPKAKSHIILLPSSMLNSGDNTTPKQVEHRPIKVRDIEKMMDSNGGNGRTTSDPLQEDIVKIETGITVDEDSDVQEKLAILKNVQPAPVEIEEQKTQKINAVAKPTRKYLMKKEMCENCGLITRRLARHKINNKECAHQCDRCDFITVNKRLLRTHLIRHLIDDKPKVIKTCNVCGIEVDSILKHRRENKACWFKCDQCDSRYRNKDQLKQHQRCVHGDQKFICEICSAAYKHSTSLRKHLRLHKYGREFTCEYCGKQLSTKITLADHVNTHTQEALFECPYCDKTFYRRNKRSSHVVKEHPESQEGKKARQRGFHNPGTRKITFNVNADGIKEYVCKVCDRKFLSASGFYSHKSLHTAKLLKCDQCSFQTTQNGSLTAHKRIHTGEKPFQCTVCDKTFRQHNHLYYHNMIHKNIKRFSCRICSKAFVLKHNLTEHELRHKGLTPFHCHVCSRGFYSSSARKKHVLTTHGAEEVENIRKHTWKIDYDISDI